MSKKVELQVAFEMGERVEFNNRIGKDEGVIVGYYVSPEEVLYAVVWSDKKKSDHYKVELKSKP